MWDYKNKKTWLKKVDEPGTLEIDFTEDVEGVRKAIEELRAEEKAGYPPKCNPGYEVNEDKTKCVKIVEDKAKKKENPFKKKGDKKSDKKSDKKGEEKEDGKNLPPWLKKKKK